MTIDTHTASAPAELAWSQCDDPYLIDCPANLYNDDETREQSSRWTWAVVIAAWAAGAAALAVVVGMAFVAFTPQPTAPPHSTPSTDSPYPFIGLQYGDSEPARNT